MPAFFALDFRASGKSGRLSPPPSLVKQWEGADVETANTCKVFDAMVEEVHSGDDFLLMVDLGIGGLYKKTRARLHGVDAPNAFRAGPQTTAGRVRDEVRTLVLAKRCRVTLLSEGRGGWIVTLETHGTDGEWINVNRMLQERGYVYSAGSNQETRQ